MAAVDQDAVPVMLGWCCDPGRDPHNAFDLFGDDHNPLVFCNFHRKVVCEECSVDFTAYNQGALQDPELPEEIQQEMLDYSPPLFGPADAGRAFRMSLDVRVPSFQTSFQPNGVPSLGFVVLLTWKEGGMIQRTARVYKTADSFASLHTLVRNLSPELRSFHLPVLETMGDIDGKACTTACHELLNLLCRLSPMPTSVKLFLQTDDRAPSAGAGAEPQTPLSLSQEDRERLEGLRGMMHKPLDADPDKPSPSNEGLDNEHQRPRRVIVSVGAFVRRRESVSGRNPSSRTLKPKLGHVTYRVTFVFSAGPSRFVVKRYSEFEALYSKLSEQHPELRTIDFPKKMVSSNLYGSNKEIRREKFEQILQMVIEFMPLPEELCEWIADSEVTPPDEDSGAGSDTSEVASEFQHPSSTGGNDMSYAKSRPVSTTDYPGVRDGSAAFGASAATPSSSFGLPAAEYDSIQDPITRGHVMDTLERAFHEKHAMENELLRKKVELSSATQTIQEDLEVISAYESRLQYHEALSTLRVRISDWERDGRDGHIKFLIEVRGEPNGVVVIDNLVRRRYREFLVLDRRLSSQIPLPGKLYFVRNTTTVLEARRRALEAYLQRAVQMYAIDRVACLREFLDIGLKPAISSRVSSIVRTRSQNGGSFSTASMLGAAFRASAGSTRNSTRGVQRGISTDSMHSAVGSSWASVSRLASSPAAYRHQKDSGLSPPPRYSSASPVRSRPGNNQHESSKADDAAVHGRSMAFI